MLFEHEKRLKQLLEHHYASPNNPWEVFDFNIDIQEFEYLEEKNLIQIRRYIDGGFAVKLSASGITYFNDKRNNLIRFWIPITISSIALLKSFQNEIIWGLKMMIQSLKYFLSIFH